MTLLGAAGVTFIMGVPGADDIMLNYQSTSFHDQLFARRVLGLQLAPGRPVEVDPIASNPVVIIVSALMKAVGLQPSATWDPSLPADTPIGLAVLGWVWRQVERSFFNGSPVAVQSDSVSDDLTGVVTGTAGSDTLEIVGMDACHDLRLADRAGGRQRVARVDA